MSQNAIVLPTSGTISGLQMTQATNNALDTLNTLASGGSAPASPEAGQLWHDTTNNLLKIRSLDNTTWVPFLQLNETAYAALPYFPAQITGNVNRIINAAMAIDQVNEGAAYSVPATNSPIYSLDQWIAACESSTATGITTQRVSDAPAGFSNSLKVTVGTGASSVGATDFLLLSQRIEANNLSDLNYGTSNAAPVSISFWVKSSVTGTFAVALQNAPAYGRSLVQKFTVTTAGVWQLITLPLIPGDQAGTWNNSGVNAGLEVFIGIAAGSTYQTSSLNAWAGTTAFGSTSQTNGVLTTTSATFQITGVMLNPGPFCLPFETRSVQQDLALCQRYYEKTFNTGVAVAQNAGIGTGEIFILSNNTSAAVNYFLWQFATRKRTAATAVTYNPAAANANWRDTTTSADKTAAALTPTEWCAGFYVNATTALSDNLRIHITANARL